MKSSYRPRAAQTSHFCSSPYKQHRKPLCLYQSCLSKKVKSAHLHSNRKGLRKQLSPERPSSTCRARLQTQIPHPQPSLQNTPCGLPESLSGAEQGYRLVWWNQQHYHVHIVMNVQTSVEFDGWADSRRVIESICLENHCQFQLKITLANSYHNLILFSFKLEYQNKWYSFFLERSCKISNNTNSSMAGSFFFLNAPGALVWEKMKDFAYLATKPVLRYGPVLHQETFSVNAWTSASMRSTIINPERR